MFEIVYDGRTDDGRTPDHEYPISSPIAKNALLFFFGKCDIAHAQPSIVKDNLYCICVKTNAMKRQHVCLLQPKLLDYLINTRIVYVLDMNHSWSSIYLKSWVT